VLLSNLAPKHVTVSTVGVLKSMQRLSDDLPAVMLAVSLHAPNQEVRMKIVPAASAHKIDKIMAAIDLHIERNKEAWSKKREAARGMPITPEEWELRLQRNSGKRPNKITGVMIEYILIKGVNDLEEHAHELGRLLVPRRDHILLNLIPYNPTEVAEDYEPPTEESVRRFFDICISEPYVIHTRVRQEMGQDVAAACGVSKKQDSAPRDIEDYGSRTRTKQTKTKIRERNAPSPDFASHISRANMLCYVSVALPLAVVSILELIRPAQ
jgi:adenine C2-methylase RlmN of 23S rRNA A2503 and tRNA A37